jgi:hypothetical protein
MTINSEFIITVSIFCAAILIVFLMYRHERRPKMDLTPSLIPTTPLLYAAGITAMIAGVHLLNLFGLHTGR